MAFNVSGLPAYVQDNRDLLIKNFGLLGGGTRSRIHIQTGVKLNAPIHLLNLAPVLQNGGQCELEPQGDVVLTDRLIETAWIETLIKLCPKDLKGKWAEYLLRVNATAENIPFEQYIADAFVMELNKAVEKLIWQGDKTQTSDPSIKWIDGFAKIFSTDGSAVTTTATTLIGKLNDLYAGMSSRSLAKGGEIYLSPANYRKFLLELVNANLYHYSSADSGSFPREFYLPGTDVKVVFTEGLEGVENKAFASFGENLVYGCDMEHDEEDVKFIYDPVKEVFYAKALWNSGVQIALPGDAFYMSI